MGKKRHSKSVQHGVSRDSTKPSKHDDFVNLYRSDNASDAVDMTTLDRGSQKKRFFTILFTAVVGLSVVAASLGYLAFSKNRLTVSPGEVTLTIEADKTVASGDQLDLDIHYTNSSAAGISKGAIELVVPAGFYFVSSDPVPADGTENHWDISDVPAGAEGTIHLTGQVVGQVGDIKDFTALLTYTPVNFSSDFQTSANTSVTVGESIMKLDVSVPEQVRSGEELSYVFTITNAAALPLVNAKAVMTYPAGFQVASADPKATQGNATWLFEQIDPNATTTVTVKGTMSAEADAEQEFILQTGIEEANGFLNLQAEDRHTVKVINPELSLTMTAPRSAQAGGEVQYDITVSNPSKIAITDITLAIEFSGNAVTGNATTLDPIAELKPGDETSLTYTAVVKDPLPESASAITATLSVDSAQVTGSDAEFSETVEVVTTLQGTLEVTAEGRYFSDDLSRLGSGPLPPTVGKTTSYVIRWSVTAGGAAMSDVMVQTTLPDGTSFVESADDAISFDAATNIVSWSLEKMEAGSIQAGSFTVSVTPTKSDVNKLMALTNETVATATDANSGESVQAQDNKVTTNLANDPGAEDDGIVVE
ncbi:MAG: DUF11 domain-containing protein [Candidatus Kerfeldbacteria bacterium]|nr:DUF11 domain-containing protein [Candidatus Kerfeldbacteria bacterium]